MLMCMVMNVSRVGFPHPYGSLYLPNYRLCLTNIAQIVSPNVASLPSKYIFCHFDAPTSHNFLTFLKQHPYYQEQDSKLFGEYYLYDLALVQLTQPVHLSNHIQLICLPPRADVYLGRNLVSASNIFYFIDANVN
jgi:hypothetical protein